MKTKASHKPVGMPVREYLFEVNCVRRHLLVFSHFKAMVDSCASWD